MIIDSDHKPWCGSLHSCTVAHTPTNSCPGFPCDCRGKSDESFWAKSPFGQSSEGGLEFTCPHCGQIQTDAGWLDTSGGFFYHVLDCKQRKKEAGDIAKLKVDPVVGEAEPKPPVKGALTFDVYIEGSFSSRAQAAAYLRRRADAIEKAGS